MGGVLVNGCGASDSYQRVSGLGQFYCKYCRKDRSFGLFELKRKVRVVWVPIVTLNTKYAVICEKCRNGIYVEEEVRDEILRGNAQIHTDQDGIKIAVASQHPQQQGSIQGSPQSNSISPAIKSNSDNTAPAKDQGLQQPKVDGGAQPLVMEKTSYVMRKKICPACGLHYSEKKERCDICGGILQEE